jgi:carboxymethylenebutenolidase
MSEEPKDRSKMDGASRELSRRDFVAFSVVAGIGASESLLKANELPVIEKGVEIKTSDGVCDAVFIHPPRGAHPGVLIWPDSLGLRPVMRELGRRIAGEGYSTLVPNHLYRSARAPVFDSSFDFNSPSGREMYRRVTAPFFAPGAAERDAIAYVRFLDAQKQVNKRRKIGTHGYCLGGAYVIRTAAELPNRIGAGASFHGGFLVTDKPDSPHLLAPKIKAQLYIAIAANDDTREPEVKDKLREAFTAAGVRAEIEVYPKALHGWCVPDNKTTENKIDANRAFNKLVALYRHAL